MSKIKFYLLLFTVLSLTVGSSASFYLPAQAATRDFVAGEFLVKFKGDEKIYKFNSTADLDIHSVIEKFANYSEVEYIEPNYRLGISAFPNDPDYPLQWYLVPTNIKDFWSEQLLVREQQNIKTKAVIAVLDTGVDLDHPDLVDKIWHNQTEVADNLRDDDGNGYIDDISGWDFVANDSDPNPTFDAGYVEDALKHGTIVAGLAAASVHNDQGISGVSWFSSIMPLRVLDSTGAGDVFSVVQAIDYAIDNGASVINMSFVGEGNSQSLYNAIKRAYDQDVLVVAAAGNTDPQANGVDMTVTKSYPVCYDGDNGENLVIGVASVGKNLVKSNFSNYGNCIDIVAPGESFYTTQVYDPKVSGFTEPYSGYWSGTSLSAPLVSGILAAIREIRPAFSAKQIRDILLDNTRDIYQYNNGYEGKLGRGLLDTSKLIDAVLGQRASQQRSGQSNYLVAGLGLGSFPQLKVLKTDGSVFKEFFAYSPYFKGEINVAVGDVNGDGQDEIITGAGNGGGPHVRIFNIEGQMLGEFFAYDGKLRGGVSVAVGDVDGDGVDEIVAGAGKGAKPEVKVFDLAGNIKHQFLAYGEGFLGGVRVAVGDVDRDNKGDIVTGAGAGGGPHVRVFDGAGNLIDQFFAYNQNFNGGVNVAVGDIHGDGQAEIMVTVEENSFPTVRIFNYHGLMLSSFFAEEPNFLQGIKVAAGDIDNDGVSEILTGKNVGGDAKIKIFDWLGNIRYEIMTPTLNYQGGVRPAIIRY